MLKNMLEKDKKLNFYYKELPYGDPQAARFEEGAKKIVRYQLSCFELTYPYTVLTWVMIDYLISYYLNNIDNFNEDKQKFWQQSKKSALYQYEIRVNNSSDEQAKIICKNVIKTYNAIISDGYNLAKPIPVAENPKGEIVAVKGAKRIASLMVIGFDSVPVLEYDPETFKKISPNQDTITCINHAQLIFSHLADIPSVKILNIRYKQYVEWKANSAKQIILNSLRNRVKEKNISSSIIKIVNELDPASPNKIAIIIENKIELIEWLYSRNICNIFLIMSQKICTVLNKLNLPSDLQIINLSSNTNISLRHSEINYQELWLPSKLPIKKYPNIIIKKY